MLMSVLCLIKQAVMFYSVDWPPRTHAPNFGTSTLNGIMAITYMNIEPLHNDPETHYTRPILKEATFIPISITM